MEYEKRGTNDSLREGLSLDPLVKPEDDGLLADQFDKLTVNGFDVFTASQLEDDRLGVGCCFNIVKGQGVNDGTFL